MTEIWRHSAGELAQAIARRDLSSREVVEAHLARIETVNPKLNAVVQVLAEDALAAADLADKAVASGAALGPLHGVPVTVKCNIDMKGVPSTWGVPAFADAVAAEDAPLITNIRAAGAIPIARTNCPDLGMRMHTDSALHGLTRNPWDQTRTTAGSSGGEASALASGMSPLGLGNDIGGSLRNPANACGIASIRPSAGRVPDATQPPFENRPIAWQLMAVHGPMARTVADVRLGLKAMMAPHPRDPLCIGMPFDGPRQDTVRVAVVPNPPGGDCDPAIAQAVRTAADALSNAGYDVEEVTPPDFEEVLDIWGQLLIGDYSARQAEMAPLMGDGGRTFFGRVFDLWPNADVSVLSDVLASRDKLARAWSMFMADYPLVLSPTWTQLPFTHGYDISSPDAAARTIAMARPVLPANLLGLPCACVPAARDPGTGLPIGVLLTGRLFRDDQCLDAAEVVEQLGAVQTPIDPAW